MTDIIVVGGGVIGLSIAYELAGEGVAVRVLEQGDFGREASWAGAGILPPGNPEFATDPRDRLRAESHVLWPELSAVLLDETGMHNGYVNCGGIAVAVDASASALQDELQAWQQEGVEVEELSQGRLFDAEPALNRELHSAYRLPELSQVRNPRHLKALLAGCAARGVELVGGCQVIGFDRQSEKIVAVRTPSETHGAGQFCVASGAWTKQLLADVGADVAIEPVRGQIVLLAARPLPFRHVIEVGSCYLVPRPDGRILVGSTEERVGYDKSNTAGAVSELIQLATRMVPVLSGAKVERCWAGLRPGSADGLPYLGRVPGTENLFVAAGHFRSGLQMSPATARLMRELVLDREPTIPLEAFVCDRHQVNV